MWSFRFFMESFYVNSGYFWNSQNKPDRKKNIFKKNGKNMIDMSEMMVMAKMGDDFFSFCHMPWRKYISLIFYMAGTLIIWAHFNFSWSVFSKISKNYSWKSKKKTCNSKQMKSSFQRKNSFQIPNGKIHYWKPHRVDFYQLFTIK